MKYGGRDAVGRLRPRHRNVCCKPQPAQRRLRAGSHLNRCVRQIHFFVRHAADRLTYVCSVGHPRERHARHRSRRGAFAQPHARQRDLLVGDRGERHARRRAHLAADRHRGGRSARHSARCTNDSATTELPAVRLAAFVVDVHVFEVATKYVTAKRARHVLVETGKRCEGVCAAAPPPDGDGAAAGPSRRRGSDTSVDVTTCARRQFEDVVLHNLLRHEAPVVDCQGTQLATLHNKRGLCTCAR
mmetsp:Transcript_2710/g.9499  ORF Transcript_2710/g.9499 Transcript_2710/m.9499 type:complete len:244 (+) Transcript_2710:2061-2792(+)